MTVTVPSPAWAPTTSWNLLSAHSVTIRELQPDDAGLEAEFLARLSADSRHKRFLGAAVTPLLTATARPEKETGGTLALAATITLDGREEYIGLACLAGLHRAEAEFALVVADDWQGCGMGRQLLLHLVHCAKHHGIARLVGDVLADNRAMLDLARSAGFHICAHSEGAQLRLVRLDCLENTIQPAAKES
jgi:acetyltransferase